MEVTPASAPDTANLQPMKPAGSQSLPVHQDLTETMVGVTVHPDPVVADVLAACSGYAYGRADTVAMIMARKGLEKNRTLMISEVVDALFICSTAFVVQSHDGRVVLLCFRGTEPTSIINWLLDFDLSPERVKFGFGGTDRTFDVHGGFYRNVLATRHEIVAALKRAADGRSVIGDGEAPLKPMEALYITGHSLGAAMATLTALTFVTDDRYHSISSKLKAVYNFGQPMIAGPDLARAANASDVLGNSLIRYVNGHDIVPQLPPRQAGPFAHFGREFKNDPFHDPSVWEPNDPPTTQLKHMSYLAAAPLAFVARQLPRYRKVRFRASLYDHYPQHYIASLTTTRSKSEYGD